MGKMAILILAGAKDPSRIMAGLNVAYRLQEARPDNGLEALEVFLFSDGVKQLGELQPEIADLLQGLRQSGVVVGACSLQLEKWHLEAVAQRFELQPERTRDSFARYAREGYTVISF